MIHIQPYKYASELNCRILQVLSVFKKNGFKIEWLFFNSLISFENLFDYCIENKKRCFGYDLEIISDNLFFVNVSIEQKQFENFYSAKKYIVNKIFDGNCVFLRLDSFYFQHRTWNYNRVHDSHSYIICDYDKEKDMFFVQDFYPNFSGYISSEIIEKAFNDENISNAAIKSFYPSAKSVVIYNLTNGKIEIDKIHYSFVKYFLEYKENYNLYKSLIDKINSHNISKESLIHLFNLLTVSRSLFVTFLDFTSFDQSVITKFKKCFKISKKIRDYLEETKQTDCFKDEIIYLIENLETYEFEALNFLKSRLESVKFIENKNYKYDDSIVTVLKP